MATQGSKKRKTAPKLGLSKRIDQLEKEQENLHGKLIFVSIVLFMLIVFNKYI